MSPEVAALHHIVMQLEKLEKAQDRSKVLNTVLGNRAKLRVAGSIAGALDRLEKRGDRNSVRRVLEWMDARLAAEDEISRAEFREVREGPEEAGP